MKCVTTVSPSIYQNTNDIESDGVTNRFEAMLSDIGPIFNNQNTVLMASFGNNKLMLMHETRIFYFKGDGIDDYNRQSNELIATIIGIFTTRKYRLLWSLYLLSKFLDVSMFWLLIVTLFFDGNGDIINVYDLFVKYWIIYLVVGFELSLSILEYNIKIWILSRLSIYIHTFIYILYILSFSIYNIWNRLTIFLFGLRLIAFIIEEIIDFCIDLELHYDLQFERAKIHRLKFLDIFRNCFGPNKSNYNDEDPTRGQIYLDKWEFEGSLCAWTWKNAFMYEGKNRTIIKPHHRYIFIIMFIITYGSIGLILFIIISISTTILGISRYIFTKTCGNNGTKPCKDTILSECINHTVY